MRDNYRTPSQIKTDGGKLTDFTLVLFEETLKVIPNNYKDIYKMKTSSK